MALELAVERLVVRLSSAQAFNPNDMANFCVTLARAIDFAVANNEVPASVHELPVKIKFIYRRLCDNVPLLQSAVMVLMMSVKNACKNRWFSDKDVNELLSLANEIGRNFSYPVHTNIEPTNPPQVISKVMSRFLPRMKIGHILALLEVKAGFESYAIDLQIQSMRIADLEKRLLVIQIDNTLTSSCLISPPHVNFYLNGRPVERRNSLSIDTGPQLPTNVTSMLRSGINLLQAVGQFNGDYIIAIASMSSTMPSDVPVLQDYVPPTTSSLESDAEIIEDSSRISLNCPISFTRIKTPAKGYLCKHHQCFDYENFIDINSRRPSWRCPHCNQSVCFLDLRVDRYMAKVLEEVGESVTDVIISADGSWKPAVEPDSISDVQGDNSPLNEDGTKLCEPGRISDALPNVVDLTAVGIDEDVMDMLETEDCKPLKHPAHGNSITEDRANQLADGMANVAAENIAPIDDNFWSGVLLASSFDGTTVASICERTTTNQMLSHVLTDAVSPAIHQQPLDMYAISQPLQQGQLISPNGLSELHQRQVENSIVASEFGRPAIPRQVNRIPMAVQALPVQNHIHSSHQSPRTSVNPVMPSSASMNSPSPVSFQTSPSTTAISNGGNQTRQPLQRPLAHPVSSTGAVSSSMQSWSRQDRLHIPRQSAQQITGAPTASQAPGPPRPVHDYRITSNMSWQQYQNPSAYPLRQDANHGHSISSTSQTPLVSSQRVLQSIRMPPAVPSAGTAGATTSSMPILERYRTPVAEHRGNVAQSSTRAQDQVNMPSEQNWQPSKRMRGSITGRPYSAAVSQLIIHPTSPAEASRAPPPNVTLATTTAPHHLQALLAHTVNTQPALPQQNYGWTGDAVGSGVPGAIPDL